MCWLWSPQERPTFSDILEEIHARVERIEQKGYQRIIARNQVYVNVPTDPYYNQGTDESNDFDASTSSGFFSSGDIKPENVSSMEQTTVIYKDIPTTDL